ncbi:MAG: MFS transporter [Pseudomonadota bacterium]
MADADTILSPAIALHRPICPEGRAARDTVTGQPCAEQSRPFVLAATVLASAMAFIDGTVVTIALPVIQSDFAASFPAMQWVVNAYALLLGSLILIGGGAGDRFGRKRVFLWGIVIFAFSSLACAIAPSVEFLIVGRAVQGIGGALLVPQSLAIIAASFPKDVRGRAIGVWAGASAITTAMGPPLGGFLIDALDWRAVFWINLPLSVAAIWLAVRHIPESRNERAPNGLDWPGGVLAILAFGALTYGLTLLTDLGASMGSAAMAFLVGAAGIGAFLFIEARAEAPLMPLNLFRDRAFSAANLMTLFLYGALTGILFLLPFDLIERRGLSASEVGLTLLPIGLIIGVLSRFAGAAADRLGGRVLLVAGALMVALAAGGLALMTANFWLGVVLPVIVLSIGMSLVVTPLTTVVMNAADDAHSGAASGVNNAASRLAGLFAVAILGSIASVVFLGQAELAESGLDGSRFGVLPDPADPSRMALEQAFAAGYGAALWAAALWGAVASIIALIFLRAPASPQSEILM